MLGFELHCNLRNGFTYCDDCPKRSECGGFFDKDLSDDKYFSIKNNLKVYRVKRCLSQTELGKICGLSQNTISSLEIGNYKPTLFTAYKLSHALNVPIESLFEFEYFPRA